MCVTDFDPPSFLREERRTARKERKCRDCFIRIFPGTKYLYVTGKWDGHLSSHVRCELCDEISDLVEKAECSWAYGSLIEDAEQTIDPFGWHSEAPPEVIGRLIGLLWVSRERRRLQVANVVG